MDNRRYNMMMLQAQHKAQELLADFERRFYANELRNAELNSAALSAYQDIVAPPEPIPEPSPMELGMEEALDG